MLKHTTLIAALAVLAFGGLYAAGNTYAEDKAPTASVETKTEVKPDATPTTTEAATKTKSPMCSMMKWVTTQVKDYAGDDCRCCGKAMTKWFEGGADVPLAGLRDKLVADGWNAQNTVAFLKEMKAKSGCCDKAGCDKGDCDKGDCDKGCCDKGDCDKGDCSDCDGECDKAKDAAAKATAKKDAAP